MTWRRWFWWLDDDGAGVPPEPETFPNLEDCMVFAVPAESWSLSVPAESWLLSVQAESWSLAVSC